LVGDIDFFDRMSYFLGSQASIVYKDPVIDDPKQRRPDITLAKSWLNWEPKVNSYKIKLKYLIKIL
jgi:hypothetical protein